MRRLRLRDFSKMLSYGTEFSSRWEWDGALGVTFSLVRSRVKNVAWLSSRDLTSWSACLARSDGARQVWYDNRMIEVVDNGPS
ncbi:hypothetical protein RRG08_037696 [Elysia crispata]|uniref:Uncharacterized protein n=1 Tax=Elysia crispata TaxID=231223 RepID=A0AAE1A7G5_9GAST|nr:hypothetical protein RRG08_037696 [Elysia crispata]